MQTLARAAQAASFRGDQGARRDVEMSQGTLEFNGGHTFKPTRDNQALAQLSRADLIGLGVFASPRRTKLGVLNSQ